MYVEASSLGVGRLHRLMYTETLLLTLSVHGTQGQQMGQMFPPGPAAAASGFYVPTMPRAYYPNNMQQIRPQPRWPSQQQVRGPAQPGGGMSSYYSCYGRLFADWLTELFRESVKTRGRCW